MRNLNVAITGFGGIGRKVAHLLHERRADYKKRYGFDLRIVGVCTGSAGIIHEDGLDQAALEDKEAYFKGLSGAAFIDHVPADVLVEASPTDFRTGGAALAYIRSALARRMHIIAISKGALAVDYAGIREEASRQRVALKLSGAVGSAIPTIDLIQYNLAGCRVSSVSAIVTGTTNVILSEMMDKECSFADALAAAQRLGIAESDPTLDTDGWDTACKIAILSNAAFGTAIEVEKMFRQGISGVTLADVRQWRAAGLMPRLVGHIDYIDETYQACVRLDLCDQAHPFAQVHGSTKAVRITTDLIGDFTIVGGGSHPYGTAAAALKDLEHILFMLQRPVL
ncbi:homoserine dehydrogenase [Collimonas humicola]|uniref:homoserine dehydrogenase n=1 Tax=Collimonas humicola TaxID=2825886 RepID=UPI001B8B404B|nr:homoserine dehydrogenase [Collimonas humicola]